MDVHRWRGVSTHRRGRSPVGPDHKRGLFSPPYISPPYTGGASNAPYSEVNFDTIGPAPSLVATGAIAPGSITWYAAISLTGGYLTTWQNCNIMASDPTPGGTWGVSGTPPVPTGYGFDNTLLAAFYVSPSTTCVAFGTTDGGPFGNNNYGQFGFDYGGGRTDYVSFSQLPGDANLDGRVDVNDLTIVLANFGRYGGWAIGAFNGDGIVDMNDLTIVLANFGRTSGAGITAVPEPASVVLLAIGAIGLLALAWRRRA